MRHAGSVKHFNHAKGYGFITTDGGEDVYVHASAVERSGLQGIKAGDRVTFAVAKADKRYTERAVEIQRA